jgi:hypothetical protein
LVEPAFQFLIDQHGFVRVPSDAGASYRSATLIIEPSFNERDGFETHLLFPTQGTERVAVGTILGALGAPKPHDAAAHAAFIQSNLPKLFTPSAEAYRDLAALRFWHAASWRKHWGTSITLDAPSIATEGARLLRLKAYFGQPANI